MNFLFLISVCWPQWWADRALADDVGTAKIAIYLIRIPVGLSRKKKQGQNKKWKKSIPRYSSRLCFNKKWVGKRNGVWI